jgi:hypothetical protein
MVMHQTWVFTYDKTSQLVGHSELATISALVDHFVHKMGYVSSFSF